MTNHREVKLSPSTVTVSNANETVVLSSNDISILGTGGQSHEISGIVHLTGVGALTTSGTLRVRQGQNTTTGTLVGVIEDQGSLLIADQTLSYSTVDTSSYANTGSAAYYTVTLQLGGVTPSCTVDEATMVVTGI